LIQRNLPHINFSNPAALPIT